MLLIQIGGLGIMTLASMLALVVARRLGLRSRLLAQAETGALDLGEVRRIVLGVVALSFLFEAIAATVLALRFALAYDYSVGPRSTAASSTRSPRSTTPASRSGATT